MKNPSKLEFQSTSMFFSQTQNSLLIYVFLVLILLMLCSDVVLCTQSVNFGKIVEACHLRRPVGCKERRNFLQCNNAQQTNVLNISLTSPITNVTVTNFNIREALLTYVTAEDTVSEFGVCLYRKKKQHFPRRRKKLWCRLFPLTTSRLAQAFRSFSDRPCQCVCAFNNIPDGEELVSESMVKSIITKNDTLVPKVFLDFIPIAGSSETKVELHYFSQDDYPQYDIRLLTTKESDCCKNQYAKVINRTIVQYSWTKNKEKLVKTCFDAELKPEQYYCVRSTPAVTWSDPPGWCLNVSYEKMYATETLPVNIPSTSRDSGIGRDINVVIIVAVGILAAVVVSVILCAIKRRAKMLHSSGTTINNESELDICTADTNRVTKHIFILYSHDFDEFVNVVECFSRCLESNFDCKVSHAKRETHELEECPQEWMHKKLNSDVIIFVKSEGACRRQAAFLLGKPLRLRDDVATYEISVYEPLLEKLMQRGIASDYGKVFLISFWSVDTKHTLEDVVPNRLHQIPRDFKELYQALGLQNTLREEFSTENNEGYLNLVKLISKCENILKENPNRVFQYVIPLVPDAQSRPDTLPITAYRNEMDNDNFSSLQSDSSNFSETFPLTSIDA